MPSRSITKILVFGIFDGVHPGHIDFFRQAKRYGDFLVVAVGRPEASSQFKSKQPKYSLAERIKLVKNVEYVDKAVAGDREQGSYKIVLREKPDIICLGYDQGELAKDLRHWIRKNKLQVSLRILKPYNPTKYHTTILR